MVFLLLYLHYPQRRCDYCVLLQNESRRLDLSEEHTPDPSRDTFLVWPRNLCFWPITDFSSNVPWPCGLLGGFLNPWELQCSNGFSSTEMPWRMRWTSSAMSRDVICPCSDLCNVSWRCRRTSPAMSRDIAHLARQLFRALHLTVRPTGVSGIEMLAKQRVPNGSEPCIPNVFTSHVYLSILI